MAAASWKVSGQYYETCNCDFHFNREAASWSVTAASLVDIAARPAMGINPEATEPLHLDNTGHPAADRVALARAFKMNVNALGLSWNETKGNKSGQYAPFSWHSA